MNRIRSQSQLDRDHRRVLEKEARERLYEIELFDWLSVDLLSRQALEIELTDLLDTFDETDPIWERIDELIWELKATLV